MVDYSMHRLVLAFISLFFLISCSGCSLNENGGIKQPDKQLEIEGNNMILNDMDIKKVSVVDFEFGMYKDSLDIIVEDRYVTEFKDLSLNLCDDASLVIREPLYVLVFKDMNDTELDRWIVDQGTSVQDKNGRKYYRDGMLDDFLFEIESKYGLSRHLLERKPGNNYFNNICRAEKACFSKQVESNYDDPIDYYLTTNELSDFIDNRNNISIDDKINPDYKISYMINFYNSDGNFLLTLHVSSENRIYTSFGYELSGVFIDKWIDNIKKSALQH